MDDTWKLTVWGVRGSAPAPEPDYAGYGGNTSCFSMGRGDDLVVLDAGSGLAALGGELVRRGVRRVDILLSHLHLDHVMGLFVFPLLQDGAAQVHLYGRPGLGQALDSLVGPPFWPVGLAQCRAAVKVHEVRAGGPFTLADGGAPGLTAAAMEGNHPNGCYYYRLDWGGHSMVYALDCELEGNMADRVARFAQGADVLVWDTGFFPGELVRGWGHSTWEEGLAVGRKAQVGKMLMTHYGTNQSDLSVEEQERLARRIDSRIQFAREGMVIEL